MRRVIALIVLSLLTGTASYGAVSEDVYVRKDVFEVYMQNINANQERILQRLDKLDDGIHALNQTVANLSGRVDGLDKRIDGLDKRIDGLDKRIDSLDKRIDDLRNGIYLWLVAIGLIVAWPKAREMFRKWGTSAPSITLEDVRRLIEENNAILERKFQA